MATEGDRLNVEPPDHVQPDLLSVHVAIGPKASDASSMDDLSDIEEPLKEGRPCKNCRRSRACCITLYFWVVLFFVGCLTALLVIGAVILAPYIKAKQFSRTICSPVQSVVDGEGFDCSCGKRCRSGYPCLAITIIFRSDSRENHTTVIRDNESMLRRQCSYYPPCKSSRPANEKAVKDYEDKYGSPGKTYPCLYNPDNPTEVIRTRRFRLEHVIHGMVWSSLVFILSLLILIFAIKKKGCDFL